MLRLALLILALALPARAEEVVAGLSQNRVSITMNFDGSEILIFGAIKRDRPAPEGQLHVIVTVAGPSEPVIVRRKERRLGIWMNIDEVEIDRAPSFYAVATTGPWRRVISDTEDLRHRISIGRAIRSVGADVHDTGNFTDALIRLRLRAGLYNTRPETVLLEEGALFRTSVALPANLVEGPHAVRIFLTRDRQVIDRHETTIFVRKDGLERFLYVLAHERPLVYGLLSLFIAIAAGWGASAAFRYIRS